MSTRFHPDHRIRHSREFSFVFKGKRSAVLHRSLVFTRKTQGKVPRLGVVISKRYWKRAHDRNLIKRLVKETFRKQNARLPHIDFVVVIRDSGSFIDKKKWAQCLNDFWDSYNTASTSVG